MQYSQFGRNSKAIDVTPLQINSVSLAMVALADMPISHQNPPNVRVIEILAFADVQLLDVTGPLQVFASANEWAREQGKALPYAISVVAKTTPVVTTSGLGLISKPLSRNKAVLNTLMVAGGRGVHAAAEDKALIRWLALRAAHAQRVASVCTGAFLLGTAGLLDGRRAVTHWSDCTLLARQFPAARMEVDPIFVRDERMWTSAGVTAGIDLALAMVEEDIGHAVSMAVARDLVVYLKRPGGQAQFSYALDLQQRDTGFDKLHAWIAEHLTSDLSVPVLAARAAMSERSFVRHYRAATGLTPARAVEKIRLEAAQQLLASTRLPMKRIAQRCGFGSVETLRRGFSRQLTATPQEYRNRFSGSAVSN